MKRLMTLFFFSLMLFFVHAQVVTTNPSIITRDYDGEIEVIFDATKGAGGLAGFTGDVYAHTGVITTASASDSDWKHAPTWLDNAPKYKLTSMGNNKWKLLITPNMKAYYNLAVSEEVLKLAFVFRNSDGTKEGKDTDSKDIFVTVYEAGLNVSFTMPTENQTVNRGERVTFRIESNQAARLELLVNDRVVRTLPNGVVLNEPHQFTNYDDYLVVAKATIADNSVYDTLRVCVPTPVQTASLPAGVVDGINYNGNNVTLVMYAPNKERINVIGDFNDWSQLNAYQMKRDGDYWHYTFTDVTPGKLYKFQYLVDNILKVSDAYTELVLDSWNDGWIPEGVYPDMPSFPQKTSGLVATFQTNKPAYNWEVPNFTMPPHENMVIYELLLRDFTTEKTLEAALEKLPYLKTLGVTAIELMPIHEFDGNNSWGYNPNHFFAPDKAYGSPEMYKRFIDACHKEGIAVLIDVVFNHATGSHPFAQLYWNAATSKTAADNPWFNVDAPHPYSVFHDFNHEFGKTRDYFKRVLKYWIEEYKVDGYRLDLTKGFTQKKTSESNAAQYDQSRIDILKDYYNATKAVKSDVMFILEHFCEYSEEKVLADAGMYLWRNINDQFSEAAMGYRPGSDFSGLNSDPRRWVGYAESHDEERNFYKAKMWGDGIIKTDSVARIKRVPLNIAFTNLMPGPKMIWQFGEIGYDISIDENGRTGEKPNPFGWLELPHRKQAYNDAAKILNMRKQYPEAFMHGNYQINVGASDWNAGKRIALTHSDLNMVVLGNFNASQAVDANPNFPQNGVWYELMTGAEINVSNTNATMNLKGGELRIYTDKKINLPNGVEPVNPDFETSVYPTFTNDKIYIKSNTLIDEVHVYNLQGALIKHGKSMQEVDLSGLSSGIYLLKVSTDIDTSVHRVIKQ